MRTGGYLQVEMNEVRIQNVTLYMTFTNYYTT